MDRDTVETKQSKGVLQLSNSSSLSSMKNENASSENLVDENFAKDGETQSEKSDESTENLSFLNESDLIDDILMPENIVSDDEMSNPENCVYAYRGSVSESPDLLLRNQQNNQQDDETDFLEMDFDPEQNSDADGGCYLDFQHLLADNKTVGKSLENGKNSAKLDDMNLNCSIAPPNISAISITVAPSTSQYAAKEILDATKPSTNKNTGTIPKKPLKSPNCSFIPTMSSHLYQTKSKLKDTYLINNNSNSINNNHLNSVNVSFVNKKLSNSSHINNNTINSNLNNNNITNLKNTNNNNNSNHITNNNITSYDPSLLVTPNQLSVTAIKSSSSHLEKTIYCGMYKKSDSDKNIQTTQNVCKSDEVYSNGDVLFLDKLLYVDDKKNSVNIFNQNCDEKTIIDALESIGLEPNKSIIKKYFIEMDTSEMDLPDYLLYLSKRNCDYHKLRDIIVLSCSSDKLSITFHPLHQLDIVNAFEQQQTHIVTVPIKEILKRWTASTNLKQIIKIKNKNYHTMNVLGKIINVLRQPRQRLILENFIEIPHFYMNGYLNVSKLSTSSL